MDHAFRKKTLAKLRNEGDPLPKLVTLYVKDFPRGLRDQVRIISLLSENVPIGRRLKLTMPETMALVVERGIRAVAKQLKEQREMSDELRRLKLPADLFNS